MIKIELKRLNEAFHMEAVNDQGNVVHLDASPDIGGDNKGMRPMQMLLAAAAGCSSIDIINILKKQKQPLKDIRVTVEGEREKDAIPSLFTDIHMHYKVYGDLNEEKVKRAISLSLEKYCSVTKTLEKTARVTYSYEIIKDNA